MGPAVLLAAWAVSYVRQCLTVLSAPGTPIEFPFRTPSGIATFKATSYTVAVGRGLAILIRPKVYDPNGRLLASADELEVSGLNLLRGEDQIVHLAIYGMQGRLTRLKNGKFQLEYLIPPHKPNPSPVPYYVSVDRAKVTVIDEASPKPYVLNARCDRVRVAGVGNDWTAAGSVSVAGMGTTSAIVHANGSSGYRIDCATPGLEIVSLLRHLEDLPQGRRLARNRVSASSLLVRGPVSVAVARNGAVRLQSRASVALANAAVNGYFADHIAFSGLITQAGAEGHADMSQGSVAGAFDGSADWTGAVQIAGQFGVSCERSADLPKNLGAKLPKTMSFSGASAQGWLSYREGGRYLAIGRLTAQRLGLQTQALDRIESQFALDPDRLVARVGSASWNGQILTGGLELALKDREIRGGFSSPTVDLGAVAGRFGHREWSGEGSADVLFQGPEDDPRAAFSALGRARYSSRGMHLDPMLFEASGTYLNGAVQIVRADATGREGEAFLKGVVRRDQSIDFQAVGRQLQLGDFFDRVQGELNLEAAVTGKLDAPLARGRAEAYALDVRGHAVPLVTTDFVADRNAARFSNARAIQGSAEADATGTYFFDTRHLTAQGAVTGVQVADYLGDQAAGMVDFSNVQVVGSIRNPLVTADVAGDSLILDGIKLDRLQVHASGDRNGIKVDSSVASLAGGTLKATGSYDFETRESEVHAEATPLRLADLSETLAPDTDILGTITGGANLKLIGDEIRSASATGKLAGVSVGGTAFGDGSWTLGGRGKTVFGSLDVGHLDRFVALKDLLLDYGGESPTLSGSADLYNLQLQDIINTGIKYVHGIPDAALNQLYTLNGSLDASVDFSGDVCDPAVTVRELTAQDLTLAGEPLGTLQSSFSRKNGVWDIANFRLSDGQSTLTVGGTIAEVGEMRLDGDLSELPVSRLAPLDPRLSGASGRVSASFSAAGETAAPRITASLDASGLLQDPSQNDEDRSLRLELAPITISQTQTQPNGPAQGGIQLSGTYFYRGFVGQVSAALPFEYPFKIPDDRPIQAHLTVSDRSLKEIAPLLSALDASRTQGTVGGSIDLTGTTKEPLLNGAVVLTADSLAAEGADDLLQGVQAHMGIQNDKITLDAKASSSLGGSLTALLSSKLSDLGSVVSKISTKGADSLLDNPLSGDLDLDSLKLRQGLPDKTFVAGTLSGAISLAGTLRRPSVAGAVHIAGLDSKIPTITTAEFEPTAPPIDPEFDISLDLSDTAHVSASAADLYLDGSGSIKGTLYRPQVDAQLTVERGQVTLPAAPVRIQDGGTVNLVYHRTEDATISRLDVDLTGLTQVVGPGANDTIQSYDVTLGVKGNLLADTGLQLTAASDPPYLSQDQVLGMLGEAPALESMNAGSGVSRSEAQRQIQSALAGFALPAVTGSLTTSLAKTLELDYIQFSYNPYQNAVVSFAKALGSDFTFQGTTGISQPPPGYPFQYDYRLVLHPRNLRGILSNFSLFLGSDQYSYYKVGLLYGVRFW